MGLMFRKSYTTIGGQPYFKQFIGSSQAAINNGFTGSDELVGSDNLDELIGSDIDEGLIGLEGRDFLSGGAGDDALYGGDARDTLIGGGGQDTMFGQDGNDRFVSSGAADGDDFIFGGEGQDWLSYRDASSTAPVTLSLRDQSVTRSGFVDTYDSIEKVIGSYSGRDKVVLGGSDAKSFIDYNAETGQVSFGKIVLLTNPFTGAVSETKAGRQHIFIRDFETIYGGRYDDTFSGSAGDEAFYGFSGDDILIGKAGNDTLYGGAGQDTITPGLGSDIINGGSGTHIDENSGNSVQDVDVVTYEDESTSITFDTKNSRIMDGVGTDRLTGIERVIASQSGAADTIDASGETDDVTINLASSTFSGLSTSVTKLEKFENIVGGAGDDTLTGSDISNTITGGAGNDTLSGRSGNDRFIQGPAHGNDSINGGSDTDTIDYTSMSRVITFNTDAGTLSDGVFTDTIDNVETLLLSTSQANIIDASADGNAVTINLDAGTLSSNNTDVTSITGFRHIIGSAQGDTLTGDDEANSLTGGGGNDSMTGGDGDDTFIQDVAHGNDTILGGTVDDTVDYSATSGLTFDTVASTITQSGSTDAISGIETVIAFTGSTDLIDASDESVALVINLATFAASGLTAGVENLQDFEYVIGGSEADTITGNAAANSLVGGLGNDTLSGLAGADTLQGGVGDDTFIYATAGGADTVDDSSSDTDTIDFSASFAQADVLGWHAQDTNSDTFLDALLIDFGGGNSVKVLNYFDNTTTDPLLVVAGGGVMGQLLFSDGNVSFATVVTLLT